MPKTKERDFKEYTKFLQDKKYEMFQQIPGLVDVSFVEVPEPKILIKTVAEFDVSTYELTKGTGLRFEVEVMEAKDTQGKPIVITDSGLKDMKIKEEDTNQGLNDFVTVGVDKSGKTNMFKIPGQKDVPDVAIKPADMVFRPGN